MQYLHYVTPGGSNLTLAYSANCMAIPAAKVSSSFSELIQLHRSKTNSTVVGILQLGIFAYHQIPAGPYASTANGMKLIMTAGMTATAQNTLYKHSKKVKLVTMLHQLSSLYRLS